MEKQQQLKFQVVYDYLVHGIESGIFCPETRFPSERKLAEKLCVNVSTVRRAFPVKKVTSSHKKGECVILAEEPVGQAELAAALDPTGYKVLSAESEPYRKKGLFGF